MAMTFHSERGFTLIELMIVIGIMGVLMAFSVPAFSRLSATLQLRGASENIASQMRLAREKAIATGVDQPFYLSAGYQGQSDYRTAPASGVGGSWRLPKGVTYVWGTGTDSAFVMRRDGRADRSGFIILQNGRGLRDTISVQFSGLVLTR
jgi:prepilin-type N-terminal cleavage/methylation domain-containing protein